MEKTSRPASPLTRLLLLTCARTHSIPGPPAYYVGPPHCHHPLHVSTQSQLRSFCTCLCLSGCCFSRLIGHKRPHVARAWVRRNRGLFPKAVTCQPPAWYQLPLLLFVPLFLLRTC